MKGITGKQYKFFKAAWNPSRSLDQAAETLKLSHHVLRRWFAEDRFITCCRRFILSQKVRDDLRRQMNRAKAVTRWEKLIENPGEIRSEQHWRFILESAWREKTKSTEGKPRRKRNAPPTCQEMLTAKPLRTDRQDLLEDIAARKRAAAARKAGGAA